MDFKQMKDEIVNEFKTMFARQVKLAQWKSADGTLTLETETDTPAVGGSIMLVTPDGSVAAPIGEYQLADGITISVAEVGVISEISNEVEEVPMVEELSAPTSIPDVAELKNAISSMLIKFSEDLEVRFKTIETKLSEQVQENEALKVELSNAPAVEKTNVAPFTKSSKVELSQMSKTERLQYTINQIKN